ncbi:MAG: ankyrin repeat domain-containing protein, partial [Treponema sp.]|nr:ankyrin repeat domain-containing protein [Treponema sp.]
EAEFDASVVKMPSAKATYVQETKPEPQKPVVAQKPANPPVPTEEKKVEPKEVEPKVEKKIEQKKVEPKIEQKVVPIEKKEEPIKVVEKPKKITEEKPTTTVVKETPKETKKEQKKQVKIEPIAVSKYEKQYLYDFAPSENEVIPEDINANNVHELAHIDSPNKADENGTTLLMKAAKTGNKWALESLIKSGANVYSKDKDGWTALMYAVRYQNNVEIINSLIEHGANVKDKNNFGTSVLQLAACYAENPEILKKILSYYKVGDNDFFKSFILAITTHPSSTVSQIAKLEIFIDRGVPLNRFHEGKTPLMYAAEYATSTKVIKLLLDNGAISSIRNPHGKTAFDFAETNTLIPHDEIYWSLNTGR